MTTLNYPATRIYQAVMTALQSAEEMGGPDGQDYLDLMAAIVRECTQRAETASAAGAFDSLREFFASHGFTYEYPGFFMKHAESGDRHVTIGGERPLTTHPDQVLQVALCTKNGDLLDGDDADTRERAIELANKFFGIREEQTMKSDSKTLVRPDDLEEWDTGGGCRAWAMKFDRGYMLITVDDDPVSPKAGNDPVVVGVYDDDDKGSAQFQGFTADQFLAVWESDDDGQRLHAALIHLAEFIACRDNAAQDEIRTICELLGAKASSYDVQIPQNPQNPSADVRGAVGVAWHLVIDRRILGLPADSVVGEACVELMRKADALLAVRARDGGEIEPAVTAQITAAVVRQCNVWMFG